MLPLEQRIAFSIFAFLTCLSGAVGLALVIKRVRSGRSDVEQRWNDPFRRLGYALKTTLTQSRTFQKRPGVSLFHSFIFYGFVFYLLVNVIDALEGYLSFDIPSGSVSGKSYNLGADILTFLVVVGVLALVLRRFVLPQRRDFRFNARTLLHPKIAAGAVSRDSIIVSAFICFHVGSRMLGSAARIRLAGADSFQPFATALSKAIPGQHAEAFYIFGYWGALGSVLLFFSYFPYSKHLHLFAAPVNYFLARQASTGEIPLAKIDLTADAEVVGVAAMGDFAWPRLLDAYACIQCNRCQDVCPATATGKALSPAALEINKRMEINDGPSAAGWSKGSLFEAVISREALWACTTCGACMQVCPTQNEQMLDIVDIRRNEVMIKGEFPSQLQAAFRGMERAKNPWGIKQEQRMDWAQGLNVLTVNENPEPDVLYWVGCAASYDPQARETARAFVQLLQMGKVNFAVLGEKECCTGDSARRAGNEYLYQELAAENISKLNEFNPKKIVVTCPHCLNSLGNEYGQLGGNYTVVHHTQFLDSLVSSGDLPSPRSSSTITYHDPCYLGRHNGVYDAPRNLLRVLGQDFIEMERHHENSFCCGAGGAQFWKEEEQGDERISSNRYREAQRVLGDSNGVLAVGCPFCKSMLDSTPSEGLARLVVKDVAEMMLEALMPQTESDAATPSSVSAPVPPRPRQELDQITSSRPGPSEPRYTTVEKASLTGALKPDPEPPVRKKWQPSKVTPIQELIGGAGRPPVVEDEGKEEIERPELKSPTLSKTPDPGLRKKWAPKSNTSEK